MVVWRRIKNGMSVILLLAFIFYIGYCTKELYTRVLNNRKYSRLIEYEKEIDALTNMLGDYKKDANKVQRSLQLLREALDQVVINRRPKSISDRWCLLINPDEVTWRSVY